MLEISRDQAPDAGAPAFPWRRIAFGADYNPEQWPREVVEEDIALMSDAGVNLVSVGIFSWTMVEPQPGRYEFGAMDEILDRLHAGGIRVDLATPTAAPPQWFSTAYPESVPVRRDGTRFGHAARQAFCPSSLAYREAATAVTTAIVSRYRAHPAVVMWHVHNEYGCHNARCYCEGSSAAFRTWAQDRYGSLDALNESWGNAFWNQTLTEWEQLSAPRSAPTWLNPAHELDFARFSSDELLACYIAERDIIKSASPHVPVTTNLLVGQAGSLDYWKWSRQMDVVANDYYLEGEDERNHVGLSLASDLTRSLARGPWMLMEHSTSAVNWQRRNIAKRPGELARNSLTHVARGADAVMFFQWRASTAGAEKFHSAMVPHAGTDTRVWKEVTALGARLAELSDVAGSDVISDVAILFDFEAGWAVDMDGRPSADIRYADQIRRTYDALWDAGYTVDFAHPESDLTRYKMLIAPALYLVSDAAVTNITTFHDAGGTVVISYFSGIVDTGERVRGGRYPGAFRRLLSASSDEFLPLRQGQVVNLSTGAQGSLWSEPVRSDGAEVIARYSDGPAAGHAAITRNERAWYVSTQLSPPDLHDLFILIADSARVPRPLMRSEGIEIVCRRNSADEFLFLMNHTPRSASVEVPGERWVVVSSSSDETALVDRQLLLRGGAVGILRRSKSPERTL